MHGNIGTLSGTKGKLEGHKWKYMEVHANRNWVEQSENK